MTFETFAFFLWLLKKIKTLLKVNCVGNSFAGVPTHKHQTAERNNQIKHEMINMFFV